MQGWKKRHQLLWKVQNYNDWSYAGYFLTCTMVNTKFGHEMFNAIIRCYQMSVWSSGCVATSEVLEIQHHHLTQKHSRCNKPRLWSAAPLCRTLMWIPVSSEKCLSILRLSVIFLFVFFSFIPGILCCISYSYSHVSHFQRRATTGIGLVRKPRKTAFIFGKCDMSVIISVHICIYERISCVII